jgi:hypothetical protein
MPLKVLHGMLVDPPIAVVGLSNWVLDAAKMNRAICLQRTEPTESDIQITGQSIVDSTSSAGIAKSVVVNPWLQKVARAYLSIYDKKTADAREFFGMVD